MPEINHSDGEWTLDILRQSLETSRLASQLLTKRSSELPLDDPEKLEYLRELIQYILDGRTIVASYNIAILFILLLFTAFNIYQNLIQRRKRIAIETDSINDSINTDDRNGADSSSSSTLEGAPSPPVTYFKHPDTDTEQQPLLLFHPDWPLSDRTRTGVSTIIRSWLMYQPCPIPFINRTLPSNGTSLFVAAFLGLNVFFHLYKLPFETKHFFVFADRAGYVFIVNLPLLYLLAAKNQPLKLLTGRSYEALNIYHRRVGELMCFEALVHFVGMVLWRMWLQPKWLATNTLWHYFTHPLILLGIGAFISYELLYFTSLSSFRQRWYELFLASHVILQIAALVLLWLHFFTSRPYVLASLAIFITDRIVWRIGLKSTTMSANVEVLEDGETVLLSAQWDMPRMEGGGGARWWWRWSSRQTIRHGWEPADHVFISIPQFSRTNALQTHPFTISSPAPDRHDALAHASLDLLIRAYSGFTQELLKHAKTDSAVTVRIDGPYGSQDPLNALRAKKSTVFIAGGSGIAVVLPLLWDLAITRRGGRKIHLMWIIHSRSQRSWVPTHQLDKLRQAGVSITIPPPTAEVGRPDVANYIAEIAGASLAGTGVVVSGPDGLNRAVRNACAREVRAGIDIDLRVEKFGW